VEEHAKSGVSVKEFGGAIADADPRDLKRNQFQELQNLALEAPGFAISRRGMTFRQFSPFTAELTAVKRSHSIFTVGVWTWLIHDLANSQFRAIDATGATLTHRTFQPAPTWHVDARMSFCRTSGGELVISNGIDRPWKYNGQDGTGVAADGPACALGIDPPTGSPFAATPGGGGATAGTYLIAYRFVDQFGNPSVLSPTAEIVAASGDKFEWTVGISTGLDSSPRVTKRQLFRTRADDANTFYLVTTLEDNSRLTYNDDTLSDDDLAEREALPLTAGSIGGAYQSGGIMVANRFVVPPTHKRVAIWHEDRQFWMADGRYATGTLAFTLQTAAITAATNATPIVVTSNGHGLENGQRVRITGVLGNTAANGTWVVANKAANTFELQGSAGNGAYTSGGTWTRIDAASIVGTTTVITATMIGWEIFLNTSSVVPFTIVTVTDETHFTVSPAPAATFAGVSYAARPARTERNTVYFSEPEEPESVPQAQNNIMVQYTQADEDDEIIGGFAMPSALYALKTRHTYSIDYVRQGKVSAGSAPVAFRGAFNNSCCEQADVGGQVIAFLMDCYGMWSFAGQGSNPVGAGFQNYWRDGLIDFSKSESFFITINRTTQAVRFFVVLTADGGTYPKFCFCYSWTRDAWWTESRPWEIHGGGTFKENGRDTYFELPFGYPMVYDDGYASDGIQTAVRGTIASYTSGTGVLVSTASIFTAAMVGFPVSVTSGNGEQQTGLITAYTNGTTVTVSSSFHSTSVPAAGDTFAIGGIPCRLKTPQYDIPAVSDRAKVEVALWYRPTTNNGGYLSVRHYYGYRTSPEASVVDTPEQNEYCENVLGSANARSSMYTLKNGELSQTGVARKDLSGASHVSLANERLLTVEAWATAVGERLRITQVDVAGVV